MKINLRESLGRLDLLTDNKYDLRNTYDSSNISNDKKKMLAESLNNNASAKQLYSILNEDTIKQNGKWVNKGSEGTHGKFRTKKAADAQRKAMFANGYKGESLKEELVDVSDYERVHDESRGGKVYALYRKIENGKGVWAADEISSKTFEPEGRPFRITYRQAIGDEPINNSEKLGMRLGKMLLPKNESLEESVEDDYMKHADADARKVKSLYRKNKDIGSAFSSLGYTDNGDGSYEKEVEDNVFIVFEYDEDSERLEYKVVNEETRTGTPSNVLNLSKKLKERVQRVSASKYNSPIKEFDWDSDGSGKYYVIYHPKDGTGGCDADVYSDWRQKGRYVLDRIDGNSVGKGKLTKAEVQNLIRQYCSNGRLDEDWEPDEWEETDFLDNDGKKVYINIIKEAEDIDDLKDIAHDLYWHDKGLFAMLRHFPKDKSFEWIQNRMIEVIKSTMNESLTEKLVDAPQEIVDKVISILNNNGFVIDESLSQPIRKTYRGTHVQVINEDSFVDVTADEDEIYDQLEKYIPDEMTNEIDSFRERYGVPVTWNFGVNTDGKVTGGLDIYKQYVPDSNESLNEDTYTTNEINKFIRRAMSMANSMKKDFYVVETYIEDGTQFNGYAVTAKVDPQDKVVVKASYKDGKVSVKKLKNESLTEASYGGAYDIEDDMFWTKDDLIEFSDAVCEKLADKFGYQYDIADVGAENNNDMYITIMDTTHDIEADVSFRIKMSRIRAPRDLMKYLDTVVSEFVKKFEEEYQYYEFDESLNEDMSKPDFVVGFYAGPTDEETLEITNPKKLMDVGVSASELKKEYRNVEKLLSDYTSQTADKLKDENHQSYLKSLILSFAERKAKESGKLDKAFRDEQRKFSDADVSMDIKIEEVNYPFEDGIKKLSKQLGKMLLPKRENLTEDVYDEESDFGDGSVEEGDTFIEDGRTWSWIERIAGPIHLDFDNWAVWSARDWDYIEEKVKPLLVNKEEFNVEVLTKIYDEAEVAYFVVDEDTGFIDWGPVESQTEAQDFLNGKVEDWENDDEYDESLKESKQLKESSDITDNGYSYTLHYEDIGDGKEYDYEVSSDEMFDFLNVISWENGDGPEDIDREDNEQWDNWVADNIDELIKKYENNILDHFREDASQEEYDNRDSDDREFDY